MGRELYESVTTCSAEILGILAEDPQLEEFLRVMQPRNKAATWANDDAVPEAAKSKQIAPKQAKGHAGAGRGPSGTDEEDEAEFQDLPDPSPIEKGAK